MFVAGTVLHLAGSGRLILRAETEIRSGTVLYDRKGRRIAKAAELFGPVNAPYVSTIPLTDRVKRTLGQKVYASKRGGNIVDPRR